MSSAPTCVISSTSPAASLALGHKLGAQLQGGELLELTGDLGSGKTVIVRGLAAGLGYTGTVTSPSFTISRVYQLPNGLELQHFDFYRVATGDVVAAELAEVLGQPEVIVAVEWASNIGNALPAERLTIQLEAIGTGERRITLTAHGERYRHLLEAVRP